MNKKIVHDALVLTAFTLVLGFLLGVVYDITKEKRNICLASFMGSHIDYISKHIAGAVQCLVNCRNLIFGKFAVRRDLFCCKDGSGG